MEKPSFQLTQGDAVAWLRTLPAASVDLVITDPPYESLEKHRAIGTTTRLKHSKASSNDWFSIFPNARFPELFAEVYRVLRKDSHFYLFCDPETMFVAKPLAEAAGFKFWKPIIWDKCLGPDTLVWTESGTKRIADIEVGDRVAIPEGGTTRVKATRRTRSPAVRLTLSDGTDVIASRDHRFMKSDGELVEAIRLRAGHRLCTRPVRLPRTASPALTPSTAASTRVEELQRLSAASGCGASPRMTELERLSLELIARAVRLEPATVTAIEDVGMQDLVDISIEHADELFLLANGVVTHNCTIGMGYHYRARYECVLFFEKGKRKLNDLGVADIIEAKRISGGYPAEKPPEVSEVLVKQSSEPGELVVDPFSGSGSVGVATVRNGRDFRGNDLCLEAVEIARSRLIAEGAHEGVRERRPEAAPQLGLTL
jgi:DNA modification methylase